MPDNVTDVDLFAGASAPEDVIDPNKDWAGELIGPGKRYKDIQTAARAIVEKDKHIGTVETEAAALREDLRQRVTLQEVVDRLGQRPQEDRGTQPRIETDPPAGGLTQEQVAEQVNAGLRTFQEAERRKTNASLVKQELAKMFGKDYVNRLKAIADTLQVSGEFLNNLAADRPQVFLKLISQPASGPVDTFAPPRSTVNDRQIAPGGSTKNWKYYEDLRKRDPKAYQRAQKELHDEAIRQGSTFFD